LLDANENLVVAAVHSQILTEEAEHATLQSTSTSRRGIAADCMYCIGFSPVIA
jgi:hypothetical protein